MKKWILFLVMMRFVAVYPQTNVSGNQSGTWTLSNSPYLVTADITIPAGQTLYIEAGVIVNFQGHYRFIVNGKIVANGTDSNRIYFTTDNPATGWGGIRLDGTPDISEFHYCTLEYGKTYAVAYPNNHGGAVMLKDADAEFYNCIFRYNSAMGDEDGMGGAVYAINTGTTTETLTRFIDCTFTDNQSYGEGGAIKFTNDGHTELSGCEFTGNHCSYGGGAISFYSVLDVTMTRCLFVDNYTDYSNGGAIHTLGYDNTLTFTNCTFYGNQANGGDAGAASIVNTTADFTNCIIKNNPGTYSDNVFLGSGGAASINYSDTPMPDGATGSNNIDLDPLFVSVANADFHLQSASPCVDAGTDVGLFFTGSAPDMGCFEYDDSVGIHDYHRQLLRVFPNPATSYIRIGGLEHYDVIHLFNGLGQEVLVQHISKDLTNNHSINLATLPAGTYYVLATGNMQNLGLQKFVKL